MSYCYYDRYNDRNKEVHKQGERDAFYGYQSHRFDYNPHTEKGCAYDSGYEEERRRIEEREKEERQEQERMERMRAEKRHREEYHRQLEEEEYWEQQQEKELYEQEEENQSE